MSRTSEESSSPVLNLNFKTILMIGRQTLTRNIHIREISSYFEIRCSLRSRKTVHHSHPSPLYFTELCPMQPTKHGDFGYDQPRGRIRNCEKWKAWSHAHFCRQNVGSTHHLPRIYFRREFVALGPTPLASLFRQCILFSFSSLFTYF